MADFRRSGNAATRRRVAARLIIDWRILMGILSGFLRFGLNHFSADCHAVEQPCQSGNVALMNFLNNRFQFHLDSFRIFPPDLIEYRMESIMAIKWKNVNLAMLH